MEKRKEVIRSEYKALFSIFSLILIMESQILIGSSVSLNLIWSLLITGYVCFVSSLFFLIKPLLTLKK